MAPMEDKRSPTQVDRHPKSMADSLNIPIPPTLSPEEEAKAWRKIDLRLMPILALLYLFSFLDRGASHRISTFDMCLTSHCRKHR